MTREEIKELMKELMDEVLEEREAERKAQVTKEEGRLLRLLENGPVTRKKLMRNNNFTAEELNTHIVNLGLEQYRATDPGDKAWAWHVRIR